MINEIIKNRRAVPPGFMKKDKVSKETILQLLENANWAPTHKQTEPWRFKIYTGNAKQKLAEEIYAFLIDKSKSEVNINPQKVEKLKENIMHVPVVILIVLQKDIAERIPEWEETAAVSMAVQNMWLTAAEMGLGAFLSTPEFISKVDGFLNLSSGQKLFGFFYLGHISMEYPSPGRGAVTEKTEWFE